MPRPWRLLTGFGRWSALTGAVGVSAGRFLGWAELTGLGLTLLVVVLLALPWTRGPGPRHITLTLDPDRVRVGGTANAAITACAPSDTAVRGVQVTVPVQGRSSMQHRSPALDVHRVPAGETVRHDLALPTDQRAVIEVGPVQAVRGDPFGLARRTVATGATHRLYVHPQTVALPTAGAGLLRDPEGRSTDDPSPASASFHALRDYVPGDDRRHVHWRTSARVGRLMVRQYVDDRRSDLTLVLSTDPDEYHGDDDLELAVSLVASLGVQALADGVNLRVQAGPVRLPAHSSVVLLDALAGVLPVPARPTPSVLAGLSPRPPGNLVVACGAAVPVGRIAQALGPGPEGATTVLRARRGSPTSCRHAARITEIELGDLAELPSAVRQAGLVG